MFSVEIIVDNSEMLPCVAAPISSTKEVLYHQPNINECYLVIQGKGILKHVRSQAFHDAFICNIQPCQSLTTMR